ncbi:MAG TPA: YicC/YloC family endoribonuclease [Terriglobales bacterium]|nr:YicC/YloC family endoribonuclease [Terriglobales bacterium]
MPIRSMTGFAQAKGQVNGGPAFSLSVKSVNHRFLDLHFRLPTNTDALEMHLRRILKEKLARGHVDVNLSFEQAGTAQVGLNRQLVSAYVQAFRAAAIEARIAAEPDLNAILRLPGALENAAAPAEEELTPAVQSALEHVLDQLNRMREEEGRGMERELRERMASLKAACTEVRKHRETVLKTYAERLKSRMQEWLNTTADQDRIVQEAALLADRSDIQEELVRLENHVGHFLGLLDAEGEAGKKLDFLLQEMNREANTLLSKTSGLVGDATRITEAGLAMKSDIEKAREQVQNIE